MHKQPSDVEWIVVESDADWERLVLPTPLVSDRGRLHWQCDGWILIPLLLLLLVAVAWWHTHQAGVPHSAVQMKTPAQSVLNMVVSGNHEQTNIDWWLRYGRQYSDLPAAIQSMTPDVHLTVSSDPAYLQGNQAAVRVIIYTDDGKPAYRQTRFYQRTDVGWQSIEPDPTLWGAERTLTTSYFVYHFREKDAQSVTAAAAQVDTLYVTLRRNFGLSLAGEPKKLDIDVRLTQTPRNARFQPHDYKHFVMEDRLIVASPVRYLAPTNVADAELLAQSLALPLLDSLMAEVIAKNAISSSWQPLLNGLRLWQIWEMNLPLAAWRAEIVKWLYADLTSANPGYPVVLPLRYAELCTIHKLWLLSPRQIDIPLSCTDLDRQSWYFLSWGHQHDPPTQLNQIPLAPLQVHLFEVTHRRGQEIALETLIEYTVATYGHERLPTLVAGLAQHTSWETLIPAVYGVSPAEFELGWQRYLGVHYHISLPTGKLPKK